MCVSKHTTNVMQKLNVKGRSQAVVELIKLGETCPKVTEGSNGRLCQYCYAVIQITFAPSLLVL